VVFLAAAAYIVAGSIWSIRQCNQGSALLALGVPVFLYWRRSARPA
jgi:hypothetical protein